MQGDNTNTQKLEIVFPRSHKKPVAEQGTKSGFPEPQDKVAVLRHPRDS